MLGSPAAKLEDALRLRSTHTGAAVAPIAESIREREAVRVWCRSEAGTWDFGWSPRPPGPADSGL